MMVESSSRIKANSQLGENDEERAVLFFDVDHPLRPIGRLVNRALIYGMKLITHVKETVKNLQRRELQ